MNTEADKDKTRALFEVIVYSEIKRSNVREINSWQFFLQEKINRKVHIFIFVSGRLINFRSSPRYSLFWFRKARARVIYLHIQGVLTRPYFKCHLRHDSGHAVMPRLYTLRAMTVRPCKARNSIREVDSTLTKRVTKSKQCTHKRLRFSPHATATELV